MKTLDAESLHQGVEHTSAAVKGIRSQTNDLRLSIENFISSEASFNGQGGKAVRSFYQECHLPFLSYMENVITHFEEKLVNLTSSLKSFEPQKSGFIREDFLANDVSNGLQKSQNITEQLTSESNAIIRSVNDIIYIPELQQNDFNSTIHRGQEKTTEVLEDLHSLDKTQSNNLDTVLQECQTLMNYIREVSTKFQSGDIRVSGYKVGTMSAIPAYKTVMSNLSSDSIGTSTVGKAVQAKKSKDEDEELKFGFDSKAIINNFGAVVARSSDAYSFYTDAKDVKNGFEIKMDTDAAGKKYRITPPKSAKFNTPPKNGRNYKILHENYIQSQVARGNGNNVPYAKNVNIKAGSVSALRSRVGWVGVGLGTAYNIRTNLKNNESTSKIIGDAVGDLTIGAGIIATGGVIAAAIVGTVGLPVIAGAAGVVIGSVVGAYIFDGIKINDKTIGTHIKSGVATAASWLFDKFSD